LDGMQHTLYAGRMLLQKADITMPLDAEGEQRTFQVQPGETVDTIAARLYQSGLLRSAEAFRLYVAYSGLDTGLQAGLYTLSPAMNVMEIARAMQDATPAEVDFGILAGWRAEEVGAALARYGFAIDEQEFMALVRNPSGIELPQSMNGLTSLEGFLYPGVYSLPREITARDFLAIALQRFDQEVGTDLRQAFSAQGLTLQEAVILASMIEREAILDEEMPTIASVFYNRLRIGMKLDSDPTVQYALGYNTGQSTWWTNPLTGDQVLGTVSPYNTYLNIGFPPAPIANPGAAALLAVAYPAETPYFYFRATCDHSGKHNFAVTYEEHLQNGCP
ncbi:MAG TPA: endolytic transglycosylase MltG, partial [Anaerolineaceae bacterium]|nr:endolytic transglycosylase MltG [Anaerolineaceae bacterium]